MMKKALLLCVIMLVAIFSGCLSGSADIPEQSFDTDFSAGDFGDQPAPEEDQSLPVGGQGPAAFKEYEYPGSSFDGSFQQGNMLSASYITTDDVDTIVAYYTQKLSAAPLIAGSLIQFEIYDSANNRITVGIISRGADNQINLTDWGVQQ